MLYYQLDIHKLNYLNLLYFQIKPIKKNFKSFQFSVFLQIFLFDEFFYDY